MNRFTKQIVAIISLTLLGCLYLQHVSDCQRPSIALHQSQKSSPSIIDENNNNNNHNNNKSNNNNKCKPRSNIVFIKAHKCASSAIQNIFIRYGYFNDKIFVLPKDGNYLGHPQLFQRSLVPDPRSFKSNYNILTHHSRLNYREMSLLMPNNTIFITIIRKPINLFESMFHYYKLDKLWTITFDDFNQPKSFIPKKVKENRLVGKIGINQMMFDMGMTPKDFENDDKIRHFIQRLDSVFSLVMVAERMEESLILLKRLLCWNFDDIVVFKVNARNTNSKHHLNATGIKRIEQLNRADQMLYEHFTKKFEREVRKFGQKRMKREINTLRTRTKSYYELCVNKTITNSKSQIVRFVTRREDNLMCQFLTNNELSLTKFIRKEQIKRYPSSVFQN
ncbi:Galactose-3-O-sulfotransferase [Dermatophagoides farinae]|uniref:Galactose-3-O-sulfotransferase n=1 Tax=Dermatophagoides farinae TaxID=6954 RepID=A0A922L3Z6_DERFA|nr:Galactose-3-O-sulfotransferase [Dermatophagoides farinae]